MDLSGVATSRGTTSEPDTGLLHSTSQKRKRSTDQAFSSVDPQAKKSSTAPEDEEDRTLLCRGPSHAEDELSANQQRRAISGLRPAQALIDTESDSQGQIHSEDKFPKRRKQLPEKHVLRPSTLDKLIQGIWEQIHGGLSLLPDHLLETLGQDSLNSGQHYGTNLNLAHVGPAPSLARGEVAGTTEDTGSLFKQSNVFCSKITRASRTCRSLEVIVQAGWVQQFDCYVDTLASSNLTLSRSRHQKVALTEACSDFGWSEKELRNKMAIWRGYYEIKEAGGWAALVFAGMGIYRFCKYRIGFDRDSMQRLRNLRQAIEMAADTLHPNWRRLLVAVGESPVSIYNGHPHDYVVYLDGSTPVPLSRTYLQWDPDFTFRHIDECVVDEQSWAGNDPRWTPPNADDTPGLFICDSCSERQSDDPKKNLCFCFPTLFGTAQSLPSPVMIFHTHNGRNNGLVALSPFQRGALVGEFVGLVTKGLSDVDVMESSTTSGTKYQIWQGRQGNFTRFVNHSCKANAQYQRFTWLGTQRVILVSKGIEAGDEITVDYSDKYWKGLDKKCLCGHTCCRYRRNE